MSDERLGGGVGNYQILPPTVLTVWESTSRQVRRAAAYKRFLPVIAFFGLAAQLGLLGNPLIRLVMELDVLILGLWSLAYLITEFIRSIRVLTSVPRKTASDESF